MLHDVKCYSFIIDYLIWRHVALAKCIVNGSRMVSNTRAINPGLSGYKYNGPHIVWRNQPFARGPIRAKDWPPRRRGAISGLAELSARDLALSPKWSPYIKDNGSETTPFEPKQSQGEGWDGKGLLGGYDLWMSSWGTYIKHFDQMTEQDGQCK